MQIYDGLKYHQDMHGRAREYVKARVDPFVAGLSIQPLTAGAYAANANQLALHYALPKAQLQATVSGERTPDYATWGLSHYPFI